MRRTALLVLLVAMLSLLVAAPVMARKPTSPSGSFKAGARVSGVTPKMTVASAEQGSLDIDVTQAGGLSTTVAISYRVENGQVTESTACIGQRDDAAGASTWGCGSFALSALTIGRAVSRADLAPVAIPVEKCTATGCVAATVTVAASLTSVQSTYKSGATHTRSRVGRCKIVSSNRWENAAGTGVLSVDGVAYQVAPSGAGPHAPAISRAPSTTRSTCY